MYFPWAFASVASPVGNAGSIGRVPVYVWVKVVLDVVEVGGGVAVDEVDVVDVVVPSSKAWIAVYAGFGWKFASNKFAAPCPLNVFGTQEYSSLRPQTV